MKIYERAFNFIIENFNYFLDKPPKKMVEIDEAWRMTKLGWAGPELQATVSGPMGSRPIYMK